MESQKIAHAWLGYPDFMPWYQDCFVGASAAYIKKNPEITQKFVAALLKASQYIAKSNGKMTDDIAKIIGELTGFTAAQTAAIPMPNTANNGQMSLDSLIETQKILHSEGLVPKPVSDVSILVDGSPLEAARKAANISGAAVVQGKALGN